MTSSRPRILLAVTADVSLGLLGAFPEHLASHGWDVHVVSSPGTATERFRRSTDVTFHEVRMERDPSPIRDIASLCRWVLLMRRLRPDIVSIGTPKAALLGGIAARVLRVPHRIYLLRGLRYETSTGAARFVFRSFERIAAACAHQVLAVSQSLRQVAIADHLAPEHKIIVLGHGSSNGVDLERFSTVESERERLQAQRWPGGDGLAVIGYVGRLHPDKGVDLLAQAISILQQRRVKGRLVLVGAYDGTTGTEIERLLKATGFPVELVGPVPDVTPFLRVMDVLCLPTKREGLPNVVLEAGAAGIPTVATLATGIQDVIEDGVTGILCHERDPAILANALETMLVSAETRLRMGRAARAMVAERFAQPLVWAKLRQYYSASYASADSADQISTPGWSTN